MDILNNGTITVVNGFEVDTSVRSHDIDSKVITAINRVIREKKTKTAAAKYFGLSREVLTDTLGRKSCHPSTYLTILNTLYPQSQTA